MNEQSGHDLPEMLRITPQAGKTWPSITRGNGLFSTMARYAPRVEGRASSRPHYFDNQF